MAKSCAVFCVEFTADEEHEAEDAATAFRRIIIGALPPSVEVILEDMIFDIADVQPCSVHQALERATARIRTLTEERDEARRHLCDLYVKGQPTSSNMTDKDYAAELGWDCFNNDFVGDDDHAKGGM
jgi:hypothetical protein